MGKTCCMLDKDRVSKCQLFCFPADAARRQLWIQNCQRVRPDFVPKYFHRLCEKHFDEAQFESHRADGLRKLRPDAVPVLFDVPTTLSSKKHYGPKNDNEHTYSKKLFKNAAVAENHQSTECLPGKQDKCHRRHFDEAQFESHHLQELGPDAVPLLFDVSATLPSRANHGCLIKRVKTRDVDVPAPIAIIELPVKTEPPDLFSQNSDKLSTPGLDILTEKLEAIKNDKEVLLKECKELCTVRERARQLLEDLDNRQAQLEAQIAEHDTEQKLIEDQITQHCATSCHIKKTKKKVCAKRKDCGYGESENVDSCVNGFTFDECRLPHCSELDTHLANRSEGSSCFGLTSIKCEDEQLTFVGAEVEIMNEVAVAQAAVIAAPKRYLCHICGSVLAGVSSWKSHLACHQPKHQCSECGKRFTTAFRLRVHYRLHSGERPFLCQQCGRSFYKMELLTCHTLSHSTNRPVSCKHCSATFRRKGHLYNHIVLVHEPHRLLPCSYCNKRFAERFQLIDHERMHSGDLRFECAVCKKRYSCKRSLVSHKVYAHRVKKAVVSVAGCN